MKKSILLAVLFAGAIVFLFFFRLGHIPLWSSDEGRYGDIASRMWESGDFVLPKFNGIDYLDKPVLAPVLTALSYGVFGVNAFATRFVPALAGVLGILITFFFVKKLMNRNAAALSALILSTMFGYVLVGRFAVIDMLMTLWLTLSLFCLIGAYEFRKSSFYLWAYVFMGLGFLTKGLIAFVIPGLTYIIFLLWKRDPGEIKKMRLGWGFLIILLIILPWCVAMAHKNPSFLKTFFIDQQFGRFLTGSYGRKKPFWFFLPILLATSFPWSLFLPSAIFHGLKKNHPFRSVIQFLICWVAVVFVFFSIPKSKLPYYLLPVSAAVSSLIAFFLASWKDPGLFSDRERSVSRRIIKGFAVFCVTAAAAANAVFAFWKPLPEIDHLRPTLALGTLVIAAGGVLSAVFMEKQAYRKVVLTLAATVYCVLLLTIAGMDRITPYQSTSDYAEFLAKNAKDGDLICVFSSPDKFSDLPFHLKKRVVIVGSDQGTLAAEARKLDRAEYSKWFLSTGDFSKIFNERKRKVFCLLAPKKLGELRGAGMKGERTIREDHGKILLTNENF